MTVPLLPSLQFPPLTRKFPPNTTQTTNLGGVVPKILSIITQNIGRWYVVLQLLLFLLYCDCYCSCFTATTKLVHESFVNNTVLAYSTCNTIYH